MNFGKMGGARLRGRGVGVCRMTAYHRVWSQKYISRHQSLSRVSRLPCLYSLVVLHLKVRWDIMPFDHYRICDK